VASQLLSYLNCNNLFPENQSAHRANHSTETATATAKIVSGILMAFDYNDIAALALLDYLAAFDTVDHDILLCKLSQSFGVNDTALLWLTSYLWGRLQCVRYGGLQSEYKAVNYGAPQGSVLRSLLFITYTAELCSLVTAHHLHPHQCADNAQTSGWRPPTESNALRDQLSSSIQDVIFFCQWMQSHWLQLNTSKMEFIWCCPSRRRLHIPDGDFPVIADQVKSVSTARNLGVFVDGKKSMRSHISHVAASCFSAMCQIRSIQRSLPSAAREMLVTSLVHSWLDYLTQYSRVCQFAKFDDCNQFWIRLFDQLPVLGNMITWRLCYMIATDCRLPKELSICTLVYRCLFQCAYSKLNSCFNIVRGTCSIFCLRRLKMQHKVSKKNKNHYNSN